MAAPGHTRHHVLYFLPKIPLLFCGDTLFSAGCGRLFEGTAQEMWTTFQTLLSLPDNTIMACTHEYSLANILFALSILPQDPDIQKRLQDVQSLLDNHTPTVPTLLSLEKKINLFLRCADPQVVAALQLSPYTSEYQVFAELRRRRDNFIPSN
jgi:hydroxyacylglutathione hydrolase